jgi:hypothetical protein
MAEPTRDDATPRARDQMWRLLFFSAAALLLIGLVTDGWGRGGQTGRDLGHSIVVVGGTLIVLAAVMLLLGPALYRRPDARGAWRALQVAAPVLVVGIVGPAMVAAASSASRTEDVASSPATTATATATGDATGEAVPHDHGIIAPASATPLTVEVNSSGEVSPGQLIGAEIIGNATAGHEHGVAHPEQPLDPNTRKALGLQLTVSRGAALTYPTVADAEKAGYGMVTPFVPLIGAHYINFNLVDGTFDPAMPEMLLYDGVKPESKIVGLSYFVASPTGAPDGFAGPNDHWHQHIGLCIKDGVVVGGESLTDAQCTKRGGNKVGLRDMWMVHAWVVPGWESPQGVFSPEHSGLV